MHAHVCSLTMGDTVMNYTRRGAALGPANAAEVVQYLEAIEPAIPTVEARKCIPYQARVPHRAHIQLNKYYLFTAAREGCLRCVQTYLEVKTIHPLSVSDSNWYSVLDFAHYAVERKRPGATAVVSYLRSTWSCIPLQQNITTPDARRKLRKNATRSGSRDEQGKRLRSRTSSGCADERRRIRWSAWTDATHHATKAYPTLRFSQG